MHGVLALFLGSAASPQLSAADGKFAATRRHGNPEGHGAALTSPYATVAHYLIYTLDTHTQACSHRAPWPSAILVLSVAPFSAARQKQPQSKDLPKNCLRAAPSCHRAAWPLVRWVGSAETG